MSVLQTLDRGLNALEIIARNAGAMSIAELAERLEVHRAIAYRIVATLEAHALVTRAADGQVYLGSGLMVLASYFEPQLRAIARPLLAALARETRSTSYLSAAQGEECVALMVEEPDEGLLRVGYRVGSRHPLTRGAAGLAILSARPSHDDDSDAVKQARMDGFSITRGQLQRGAVGVASPLVLPARKFGGFEGSVGVVALDDLDTVAATEAVKHCAERISSLMG